MTWVEIAALAPLAVFVLWIGIRPNDFLSRMHPTLEAARAPAAAALAGMDPPAQRLEARNTKSEIRNKSKLQNVRIIAGPIQSDPDL
jgi:hypothetical protein